MEHLMVFLFFLSFMMALFSLSVSILFYIRTRKTLLKYFILFFLIIAVKILLYNFLLYIKVNVIFETTFQLILYTLSEDISFLIIFFFPILLHDILSVPFKTIGNIIFGIFTLLAFLIRFIPYFLRLFFSNQLIFFSVFPAQDILFIIILVYSLGITLFFYRRIDNKEMKKIIIMVVSFLIFVFLDTSVFSLKIYLSSFYSIRFWWNILFYTLWNIVFIIYALRFFSFEPSNLMDIHPDESFLKKYNFTAREQEILSIMIQGKSNQEIAEKFFISLKTVKNHIYNIYQKTGAKNRIELAFLIKQACRSVSSHC
jgi:DNA-binding CsgD family transcriptional regulator